MQIWYECTSVPLVQLYGIVHVYSHVGLLGNGLNGNGVIVEKGVNKNGWFVLPSNDGCR
ncbi:hypothetical protein THOM_0836 [Trachipleistophora hominis]|uniref:Uncharacterized protein n=1 Tax=Trachipleistophora hominis TaxID=72359 RepID=L7JZN6_TRAHO|nr:hypothetical protein THOM_0836 [Trachipleistophora hominis]